MSNEGMAAAAFEEVLASCGVAFNPDGPPLLTKSLPDAKRSLQQCLQQDSQRKEFEASFGEFVESAVHLRRAAAPLQPSTDTSGGLSSSQQPKTAGRRMPSLVKVLLNTPAVQPEVYRILLEKISEYAMEETVQFSQVDSSTSISLDIPRLLLGELRWLELMAEPEGTTETLFQVLGILPAELKKEMIQALPELCDDQASSHLSDHLFTLLQEEPSLAPAILDAFSNLNVPPTRLRTICDHVLSQLGAYSPQCLPIVIKFLMQQADGMDVQTLTRSMRENIEFSTVQGEGDGDDHDVFVVTAIKNGLAFDARIAKAWLRQIKAEVQTPITSLDVLVLLLLHRQNAHRRAAESTLIKLASTGRLTANTARAMFSQHMRPFTLCFKAIVHMADILNRRQENACRQLACTLYYECFVRMDAYARQEVVGALVAHVGTGAAQEVDAAMSVLLSLAQHHPQLLHPFALMLNGILDCLSNLHFIHIRQLFRIITTLTFDRESAGAAAIVDDETHILLRKMLSQANEELKRVGAIAATTAAHTWLRIAHDANMTIDRNQLSTLLQILQLIYDNVSNFASAKALFCDELAALVADVPLPPQVAEWINENLLLDFQSIYLLERDEEVNVQHPDIEMTRGFSFDVAGEGDVVAGFVPLMLQRARSDVLLPMCPSFRLLQTVTRVEHDGDVSEIDALLSCPLWFPSVDTLDAFASFPASTRDTLCHCLFSGINWLRETLNAFAGTSDTELQGHVLGRIDHVVALEKMLAACLEQHHMQPYVAHAEDEGVVPPLKRKAVRGKQPQQPQQQQSHGGGGDTQGDAGTPQPSATPGPITQTTAGGQDALLEVRRFRPFLRELHLPVFGMLQWHTADDLLDATVNDDNSHSGIGGGHAASRARASQKRLSPPHIAFLLRDLADKVQRVFAPTKRAPWMSSAAAVARSHVGFHILLQQESVQIARWFVDTVLPSVCRHLESSCEFFQGVFDAHNGARARTTLAKHAHYDHHRDIVRTGLDIVHKLVAWPNLQEEEHLRLLLLRAIASRLCVDENVGAQQATRLCVKYFSTIAEKAPTAEAAMTALLIIQALPSLAGGDNEDIVSDVDTLLVRLAHQCVDLNWLDDERKPIAAPTLSSLLNMYMCHSHDMSAVETVQRGMAELLTAGANGSSADEPASKRAKHAAFATLCRPTFLTYFRACLRYATQQLMTLAPELTDPEDEGAVKRILAVCKVFGFNVQLTRHKLARSKSVLATVVKTSKEFVEHFSKAIMPFLARCLKYQTAGVILLLKDMQKSTRHLQSICNHSKVVQDVVLTSYVPALKRSLETLVFKAKAMVADNNCDAAFTVGVLKHKGLDGQEVPSQMYAPEPDNEEDSDSSDSASDNEGENDEDVDDDDDGGGGHDDDGDSDEDGDHPKAARTKRGKRSSSSSSGSTRGRGRGRSQTDSNQHTTDDDDEETLTLHNVDMSLEADEGVKRVLQEEGGNDDEDDDAENDDENEDEDRPSSGQLF